MKVISMEFQNLDYSSGKTYYGYVRNSIYSKLVMYLDFENEKIERWDTMKLYFHLIGCGEIIDKEMYDKGTEQQKGDMFWCWCEIPKDTLVRKSKDNDESYKHLVEIEEILKTIDNFGLLNISENSRTILIHESK